MDQLIKILNQDLVQPVAKTKLGELTHNWKLDGSDVDDYNGFTFGYKQNCECPHMSLCPATVTHNPYYSVKKALKDTKKKDALKKGVTQKKKMQRTEHVKWSERKIRAGKFIINAVELGLGE